MKNIDGAKLLASCASLDGRSVVGVVEYKKTRFTLTAYVYDSDDDDPVENAEAYDVTVTVEGYDASAQVAPCWSEVGNAEWLFEQAVDADLFNEALAEAQ